MKRGVAAAWIATAALACCGDLAGEPAAAAPRALRRIDFANEVMPVLSRLRCNACHRPAKGAGGLQLSPLGSDPAGDYAALVQGGGGRRISRREPAQSLLLIRPLGSKGCRGLKEGSPAHQLLLQWVAQGASDSPPGRPRVSRLSIAAPRGELRAGHSEFLTVAAEWSSGECADVTNWAVFGGGDGDVATVDSEGKLTVIGGGWTTVTARFLNQAAALPLTAPFGESESNFDWPTNNVIDERIGEVWRRVGLKPSATAADGPFCRRLHQQLIGRPPSEDELFRFLRDRSNGKRAALIDALLSRDESAEHWARVWASWLLDGREVNDDVYRGLVGWLAASLRQGRPLDEMTRRLLTARGKAEDNGAIGVYIAQATPEKMAALSAAVFLGASLRCAECHPHPDGPWGPAEFAAMRDPFAGIWQREEGADPSQASIGGPAAARRALADRITRSRRRELARNLVNRYWAALFGRGLVAPVDDLRPANPASHSRLLEELTDDFVADGFDARRLLKLLCGSQTYQLSSDLDGRSSRDRWFYSRFYPQRLQPWMLGPAIGMAAGLDRESSRIERQLAPPVFASGAPSRSICPREPQPPIGSSLTMIHDSGLGALLADPKGRIARALAAGKSDTRIVEDIYLATVSHLPDAAARQMIAAHLAKTKRRAAFEDVLWALINTKEFLFIQ